MQATHDELAEAQAALATEKSEHGKTLAMITDCAEDLFAVEKHLKEREAICTKGGAAYREAANIMYRCEEKQCQNNWVPEEQHHQCMSALWDADEPAADRLEMADLDAARDENEKAGQKPDEGPVFVTLALYDKCVGYLQRCDGPCDGYEEFQIALEKLETQERPK